MQEFHEQSDSEVVRQVRSGDDSAFDELMRRYKRPVVHFVYRLLGNIEDAHDIAQEVFVRVYRNLDTYRAGTKFSTWVFALARNAAIDKTRWRKRHPTESVESTPELATSATSAHDAETREVGEEIAAAIAKLPEDQRTALVLAEYHDLSYAEIAKVMHSSEKSVESRLYRAKQNLRSSLRHLIE